MSKALGKKSTIERRKKPRTQGRSTKSARKAKSRSQVASAASRAAEQSQSQAEPARAAQDACYQCSRDLTNEERALFVEEEVGRVFCCEDCIAQYFSSDIERLEKEYFRNLSGGDLDDSEREKFSHLRWITLEEPDEVWREKTLSGDYRYSLISEFQPGERPIWCVCICLFLRGEPSFLYLAFPTKNAAMVNHYRKGERVQWVKHGTHHREEAQAKQPQAPMIDGLADAWTEDETLRARLSQTRREDDIPESEFSLYEACLEESLQEPDEVWTTFVRDPGLEDEMKVYHFIRHYPDEGASGVWYVIVAKEVEDEEQIEILDAFPTRDRDLVERYRTGTQEIGAEEYNASSRLVH